MIGRGIPSVVMGCFLCTAHPTKPPPLQIHHFTEPLSNLECSGMIFILELTKINFLEKHHQIISEDWRDGSGVRCSLCKQEDLGPDL